MQRGLFQLHLVAGIRVCGISPVYETAPVGPARDTVFLNAVARLECDLSPRELLSQLQIVEDRLGRIRDSRWGPRPLDLDLLLHGNSILASPELTVPHPHLWYRRFVLDPLCDIAADVAHPCRDDTIGGLRELLRLRPFPVAIVGASVQQRSALAAHLGSRFPEATVTVDAPPDSEVPTTSQSPGSPLPGARSPSAITLDAARGQGESKRGEGGKRRNASAARYSVDPARSRQVCLSDLPGSMFEAAESVLTTVLDEPTRHNRPLRRMP